MALKIPSATSKHVWNVEITGRSFHLAHSEVAVRIPVGICFLRLEWWSGRATGRGGGLNLCSKLHCIACPCGALRNSEVSELIGTSNTSEYFYNLSPYECYTKWWWFMSHQHSKIRWINLRDFAQSSNTYYHTKLKDSASPNSFPKCVLHSQHNNNLIWVPYVRKILSLSNDRHFLVQQKLLNLTLHQCFCCSVYSTCTIDSPDSLNVWGSGVK